MNTNNAVLSSIAASDVATPDIAVPASLLRRRGWLSRLRAMLAPRDAVQPRAMVHPHGCNVFRQQNDGSFVCAECGDVFGDAGDLPP